ncbi:hypothetical protein KQX54_005924 [Cotesia glomerata]|uniref:Uncharacterized protein n=1 Tax=Cotesia glomerata TaxID=32391 RepID=A0AAV7IFA0_COTGL|nr:hypothetical protein KQX54_005924 [Cotesia glomerata]
MKFFAVLLMTTHVCFIYASKVDELCHKECGQMDLGCFETIPTTPKNWKIPALRMNTVAYCVPTDADNEIICYSMACISRKKRE